MKEERRGDNMPGVLESLGEGHCQELGRISNCQIKKIFNFKVFAEFSC